MSTAKKTVVANDNKATKKVVTKEVKTPDTKKSETKKVNKEKENKPVTITMDEVMKMYQDAGIKCYNPDAKGNYRIMGSKKGSSLNLQKHKYIIFSTEDDFAAIEPVKDKYKDLVLTKGGNSQDKSRPNIVEFSVVDTLKAILAIYAKNPLNKAVPAK